jgi:nicotinamide-nucleotide amidase
MARAAQSSFGTNIAIGITGTTGNVDANNKDSVKGEVYYCIVMDGEAHPYHLQMDVDNMTRSQIKQAYADDVFRELEKLIA